MNTRVPPSAPPVSTPAPASNWSTAGFSTDTSSSSLDSPTGVRNVGKTTSTPVASGSPGSICHTSRSTNTATGAASGRTSTVADAEPSASPTPPAPDAYAAYATASTSPTLRPVRGSTNRCSATASDDVKASSPNNTRTSRRPSVSANVTVRTASSPTA